MIWRILFIGIFMTATVFGSVSTVFHHEAASVQGKKYEWVQSVPTGFDELIVSWNVERPLEGFFRFYVSVQVEGTWSPWMHYALWGSDAQYTTKEFPKSFPARVYQDCVSILQGKQGQAFRVLVTGEEGAELDLIRALHVTATNKKAIAPHPVKKLWPYVSLGVNGLSQMTQPEEVRGRLCSPTSTLAVVRYLSGCADRSNILQFANSSHDNYFIIYGNWILNVAQAYVELGEPWRCWTCHLDSFDAVYERLAKGNPVIVSIRGPLPGSAEKHPKGHLLVVTGYDPYTSEVLCMDPAFPSDQETHVRYRYEHFMQAWARRDHISYLFSTVEDL